MNSFRTDVSITPSQHVIGLKNPVLTVGSCFADAIGGNLVRYKFPSMVNPFGVIYNPASIHKVLRYAIRHETPPEHTYLQHQQVNLNYDFHSELSALDTRNLHAEISNRIDSVHQFIKTAGWLFITYGTAWVYQRKETGEIVANCHKMPSTTFTKSLMTEQEIVGSFQQLYDALISINPEIRIILTLSPVRHIKDTLELNSVSKAVLRVAMHRITEEFANVEYFPAYEMMMDDLRDYRFYKSDMLHPTEDAEEYIWQKFSDRYFSNETRSFLKQWKSLLSALAHKPFHPASPAHQQFLRETLKRLEELKPKIDVEEEMALVKAQLKSPQSTDDGPRQ
ncbi:GSCFA domain-containing protein [Fulvivirgaceae bacterium PWU4]|uniref:GSCFA domain-containing protein n=1 Tax=Chryseosolibacter histidini TaxID=2782349 RepID=A0AAP2GJS8_9BACT|nr:GSCFA domain-containing protein [Chryseosolibacter histidini]MBT1698334.1 GSCFA domain-containing protein [Chryseosolibacter histidini]